MKAFMNGLARSEETVRMACMNDPKAPDTLGWRVWLWDQMRQRLVSPIRRTVWETAELWVPHWDRDDVVRGRAGIHAAKMPRDWRRAEIKYHHEMGAYYSSRYALPDPIVIGLVERFGKFVLGTEGWRAECVVIRKLRAPNTEIGLKLEQAYPEVEIYYEDR